MSLSGYETGALTLALKDVAAGTAVTQPILRTPRKVRFSAARIGTGTTVTGHATDYVTFRLQNGTTTIAYISTVTSGQGTMTGGVMNAMTNVTANLEVASAQTLVLRAVHASSGTAVINPTLQMEFSIID